jgi:hypothetical protein
VTLEGFFAARGWRFCFIGGLAAVHSINPDQVIRSTGSGMLAPMASSVSEAAPARRPLADATTRRRAPSASAAAARRH